ncbi:hypothetical protein B0A52_08595 [Exophiala mesophila]|uniref:Vacuolar membrane-associated protein IML1 n=1 Tax=Exophiala mesophila TaxID=212818 RepID=A0A438MTV7_EXOME|nr:hypothetical protein B0A52_08595 [Exophiala mesophila]
MPTNAFNRKGRRRSSSGSTVRANPVVTPLSTTRSRQAPSELSVPATLWVHDDAFSTEDVLISKSILDGTGIEEGDLVEISPLDSPTEVRDFQSPGGELRDSRRPPASHTFSANGFDTNARYLCVATFPPPELRAKQANLEVSVKSNIASAFGLRSRSTVSISLASLEQHTASHVELSFRDAYIARSDMWRLVGQELAGKTIYSGQKITFLGSIKLTVKSIHVNSHKVPTGYFSGTTIPVFRSEAARYVLFVQMSSEMWDFDSEGSGEIMFNRVINGFLPDLFKRWTELDVHHLVSIVLFGRLEYDHIDLARNKDRRLEVEQQSGTANMTSRQYQDFYRVVVTDMASAQWTLILNELKKDFRVFLRDISLHTAVTPDLEEKEPKATRIAGRPSTALKGNILEAINIACSQFSNDYVDRDLIRTGVSIAVVTAGTGVFEVNRDLLNLTSETLTNNGVGIDVVCLSKMPLHSVPLFKYGNPTTNDGKNLSPALAALSASPLKSGPGPYHADISQPRKLSPALSSIASNGTRYLTSFMSAQSRELVQAWHYGIPQWIDLSYWSGEPDLEDQKLLDDDLRDKLGPKKTKKGRFQPRVRMYEVQMMGLMELGMADMSIPYMSETQTSSRPPPTTRLRSKSKRSSGSRSLSHSPTLSRHRRQSEGLSYSRQGLLSSHAKALGDVFDRMDSYDAGLFVMQPPHTSKPSISRLGSGLPGVSTKASKSRKGSKKEPTTVEESTTLSPAKRSLTKKTLNSPFRPQLPSVASADASTPLKQSQSPEVPRVNRNLNYSLRGLAPPIRSIASTEVNVTNAQAHPLLRNPGHSRPTVATSAASIRSVSMKSTIGDTSIDEVSPLSRVPTSPPSNVTGTPSKPISINAMIRKSHDDKDDSRERQPPSKVIPTSIDPREIELQDDRESDSDSTTSSGLSSEGFSSSLGRPDSWMATSLASSIPRSNLVSIRNVNASNPLKRHPERESTFGRWQHLYPRKPRAATVKWRSLCTPASVPLTTEDFPSKQGLETDYEMSTYDLSLIENDDLQEIPESRDTLLREMLALRFAHGYQLVVGSALVDAVGPGSCDSSSFFTPNLVRPDGVFIFMSMGNTIQKISLQEADRIRVFKYVRKQLMVQPPFPVQIIYRPNIRTILSPTYKIREMQFGGFAEQYPWEQADAYLADSKKQSDIDAQKLRFWRARFVLIPVQPPTNSWRPTAADSDENEEEIHLRGIRILTQMWQKARYLPPEDRRPAHNRISNMKNKDKNPLRITLETLNPSELVATELDKLLAAEEAGESQPTRLLPEEEQFERDTFNMTKLAQAIQGETGIEIKNRRWHLRLHYSCFQGEDFTNWLVHNFRDIDTREEAVEFGNDLMKEKLFEHVNSRHRFKDGNYFYSINPDWRFQRSEPRQSWFPSSRKSDRSFPATPLNENPSREFLTGRSRSGSNLVSQGQAQNSASEITKGLGSEKKRRSITLSKMIRIDVDHRKRSNRPEVINLHYDRLHNPENCYHLELSWLNVTSKLVDDAILIWTTQAEKYGLKLVEVPIAEASKVPETEPFRAYYRIKLAVEPPKRTGTVTGNVYFTATSFGPQPALTSDIHLYQKALLKRFNFVLDIEGIGEFPQNVEIAYSWGKLDYRYTQFVHRSGVILAQITDEGDILLLANRLYNSRLAGNKDSSKGGHVKKDAPRDLGSSNMLRAPNNNSSMAPHNGSLGPIKTPANAQMQGPTNMSASGIIGLNVASPRSGPFSSPRTRPVSIASVVSPSASANSSSTAVDHAQPSSSPYPGVIADTFGSRRALAATGFSHYVTPEQIKDDLESFCRDRERLEAFFKEVTATLPVVATTGNGSGVGAAGAGEKRRSGGTSSTLLRPIREPVGGEDGVMGSDIPEFNLPEPVGVTLSLNLPKKGADRRGSSGD